MKRIEVKGLPANAAAYELEDGRIFRIHMDLKTPVENLPTAGDVEVETRGYQIDKSGALMVDDNLEPIMLPAQRARIPLANVREGADTMKPGWLRQDAPDGTDEVLQKVKKLPASAEEGTAVLMGEDRYVWSEGLYESVRRGRFAGMAEKPVAPLDAKMIADLTP